MDHHQQQPPEPEQLKKEHLQLLQELRHRRLQRLRQQRSCSIAGRGSGNNEPRGCDKGQYKQAKMRPAKIPESFLHKQLLTTGSYSDDCSECCSGDEDEFSTGSVEQLLRKINSQLEADTAALVESTQAVSNGPRAASTSGSKKATMRSRRTSAGGEHHRNGYSGSADFENSVIVKQRKELQLLVSELRERDTELNELVNSHQKQLTNWEADRKRLIVLEEKLRQKDQDLQEKNSQLKSAMSRIEETVKQSEERALQLQELQKQQERQQDECAGLRGTCEELEDTNYQLDRRLRETSAQLVQVETRAGQLEQDVHTAAQNLHQLLHRLKASDASRTELQRQLEEQRQENEQLRGEIRKLAGDSRDLLRVNERLQQQTEQLQKDCQLAAERERRKDELVQSQRLKQERTDAELQQLRGMYERMQMDLTALTTNLDTNRGDAATNDGSASLEADLARWTSNSRGGGVGSNASAVNGKQLRPPPSSLALSSKPPVRRGPSSTTASVASSTFSQPPASLQHHHQQQQPPPPPYHVGGSRFLGSSGGGSGSGGGGGRSGGSLPDLSPGGNEDSERWAAASKRLCGRESAAGRMHNGLYGNSNAPYHHTSSADKAMLYSKDLRDYASDLA